MASLKFRKKLQFVLLYFVLIFCCHVSCVNVTRETRDIFSYTGIFQDCSGFCQKRGSYTYRDLTSVGKCICECGSNCRTFVTAKLKCVEDKEIRNTEQSPLKFKLYDYESATGPLQVLTLQTYTKIMFHPPNNYNEICDLNDIEELDQENVWQWNSVKDELSNYSIIEIDDDDIERRFTWLDMKFEGWMMLRLKLGVSPNRFFGRIMRINVTCEHTKKRGREMTGIMVFKVNGTIKVADDIISSSAVAQVMSSTHYLTLAPSTSLLFVASTTYAMMTSSPLLTVTSSLLQPVTPSSFQLITSSSLQPMTSSSFQNMTSSILQPMTSSIPQPMTSSLLQNMTSSSFQAMMSSSVQTIKPSLTQEALTLSTIQSSMNVLTKISASSSMLSSIAFASSSMVSMRPAKTSKSSGNDAVVTGAVVATLVVLLVIVVFAVYVFKKRKILVIRQKRFNKKKDLGHANPNYPSLSSLILPALNNPLNDGIYENPEVFEADTNRRSRINAIDSAAYDSCIIVENPSAQEKVNSVYDNIPDPAENTYKALDPAKREPPAKYESLIKDRNKYSTAADGSLSSFQEPLYSEVDRLSPLPMRNGHGARGPTPPPFTSRMSYTPTVVEPIYNELENSEDTGGNENLAPTLPPRQPHSSAVVEPIYNELEDSGSQAEEKEDGTDEPK